MKMCLDGCGAQGVVWNDPDVGKATARYLCIPPSTRPLHQGSDNAGKTRPEESFAKGSWNRNCDKIFEGLNETDQFADAGREQVGAGLSGQTSQEVKVVQRLLRVGALELANVQLKSKESFKLDGMTFFSLLIPKQRSYFHVQQTALLGLFPANLMPRRGFELT